MSKTRFPKPDPDDLRRLIREASEEKGYPVCGAWLSTRGRVCRDRPVRPARSPGARARCGRHGGKTPTGAQSGTWVDGRSSRYVPGDISERAVALANDEELFDLTHEVVVLTISMEEELRSACEFGAPSTMWGELHAILSDLIAAREAEDGPEIARLLNHMERHIVRGKSQSDSWSVWHSLAEKKGRLVVQEARRRTMLDKGLSRKEVVTISAMQLEAIRTVFEEYGIPRKAYASIADAFARIFGRRDPGTLLGPGGGEA